LLLKTKPFCSKGLAKASICSMGLMHLQVPPAALAHLDKPGKVFLAGFTSSSKALAAKVVSKHEVFIVSVNVVSFPGPWNLTECIS